MRCFYALVLVLACFPAMARSDPPKIEGTLKYEPHTLVKLRAVNVPEKAAILWRVSPSRGIDRATTSRDRFEAAAVPGVYEVDLLVIRQDEGGLSVDEARATVEVSSCHPPTPPTPTPPKPSPGKVDAAIGRLSFAGAGCTATPIYPVRSDGRYDLLSAAHCVPGKGSRGVWTCQDGRQFYVVVTAYNPGADICWLRTVNPPEKPLPMAVLAKELPARGAKVWQAGYGVQNPRNREEGQYLREEGTDGKLQFWLSVSSGDSGGPIVDDARDEILGPVCCTTNKGARAFVWAGSCRLAWKMRNDLADDVQGEPWRPVDLPEIEETEEHRSALMGLAGVVVVGLVRRRRNDLADDLAELAELPAGDLEAVASGKTGPQRNAWRRQRAGELRIEFLPGSKLGRKLS